MPEEREFGLRWKFLWPIAIMGFVLLVFLLSRHRTRAAISLLVNAPPTGERLVVTEAERKAAPDSPYAACPGFVRLYGTVNLNHGGRVMTVSFCNDDNFILSSSDQGTIKIWDIENGREIRRILTYPPSLRSACQWDWVSCAAISPSSHVVLLGHEYGRISVWDTNSGKLLKSMSAHPFTVNDLAISPNGLLALSCCDKEFPFKGGLSGCLTGNDPRKDLPPTDDTVKVWDISSGRCLRIFKRPEKDAYHVVFSPDGRRALSAYSDRTIVLWDIESGESLLSLSDCDNHISAINISPDGKLIFAGTAHGSIFYWDAETGGMIGRVTTEGSYIQGLLFSSDGQTLLSCGYDHWNDFRLYDVDSMKQDRHFPGLSDGLETSPQDRSVQETPIICAKLNKNGDKLILGDNNGIISLWDTKNWRRIITSSCPDWSVFSVRISADGRRALSGSGSGALKLWDVETGKEIITLQGATGIQRSTTWSSDESLVLSTYNYEKARLQNLDTGKQIAEYAHPNGKINTIDLSPDGRLVATGGEDKEVRLWDALSGNNIAVAASHPEQVEKVAFTPGGELIASLSSYGHLAITRVNPLKELTPLPHGGIRIENFLINPRTGSLLVQFSKKSWRLFDPRTCKVVRDYDKRTENLEVLAYSSDGRFVAAYKEAEHDCNKEWHFSCECDVVIVDAETGEIVKTLRIPSVVRAAAFLPDGKSILTGNSDGTMALWDLNAVGKR